MINRDNSHWRPTPAPDIEWRDGIPVSREFDDVYYSTDDGIAESRYVFLEGSRFLTHVKDSKLAVAETGFGIGLNCLLTLDAWLGQSAQRTADSTLHYVGFEAQPLDRAQLQLAWEKWPTLSHLASRLIGDWPQATPGCHRLSWTDWNITLDLWWDDAEQALSDLASRRRRYFNIWFLDGFTPARNESAWATPIFKAMADLSCEKATFATFTAAGEVRRGLTAAGFTVHKRPGFGVKREALWGQLDAVKDSPKSSGITPWDLAPPIGRPKTAVVIGAGLAGSFAARALADRGIHVTVLEANTVASGGSSNLQGLTYTRPSRRHGVLADFALASYQIATRLYDRLLGSTLALDIDGNRCGYLQVTDDMATLEYLKKFEHRDLPFQVLDAQEASTQLGAPLTQNALFFSGASWLHPAAVCQERLSHAQIQLREFCGDCDFLAGPTGWKTHDSQGNCYDSDILILATANRLTTSSETAWLPLQTIRGQTTHMAATELSGNLRTAFCHEGYLPPPRLGIHCLGATYGPQDTNLDERSTDHVTNLTKLAAALPSVELPTATAHLSGHVALRCTTTDYLPVVGAVPNKAAFNACYAGLQARKTRFIDQECPVFPGLFVLAGLGSRGLTAGPLAAEILASEIMGEPSPVPRYLQQALSPARFLKRGIVRGQPL